MSVMGDHKQSEALDRVFNIKQWEPGTEYPRGKEDADDKGRWRYVFKSDFEFDSVRAGEYDDTPILNVRIKNCDPGSSGYNDMCELSWWLRASELANPEGFIQERARKQFTDLIVMMKKLGIIKADADWDNYDEAVAAVIEAWPKLLGRRVQSGIEVAYYTNKNDEFKGPYTRATYWNESDLDQGEQEVPF